MPRVELFCDVQNLLWLKQDRDRWSIPINTAQVRVSAVCLKLKQQRCCQTACGCSSSGKPAPDSCWLSERWGWEL